MTGAAQTLRAAAGKRISDNFPHERRFPGHASPVRANDGWRVALLAWRGERRSGLGHLAVEDERAALPDGSPAAIAGTLSACLQPSPAAVADGAAKAGPGCGFAFGDGIAGAGSLDDRSVDSPPTDPPCGIGASCACEGQAPRRPRKNGMDGQFRLRRSRAEQAGRVRLAGAAGPDLRTLFPDGAARQAARHRLLLQGRRAVEARRQEKGEGLRRLPGVSRRPGPPERPAGAFLAA